ncbi:MAG: class B sortase [Oscillospiraceae bacterium]|nr:class B sortase [Oscillospiraceae bacterium]
MRKKTVFAIIALLLGIGIMVYAGGQLLTTRQIYQEGAEAYGNLRDLVKETATSKQKQPQTPRETSPDIPGAPQAQGIEAISLENHNDTYTQASGISFEKLREINDDAIAWLYSPGTVIDYPVMRASNYSYYLNHLPDRTRNSNGSLFIDYNNAVDMSERLMVIYGHHMKSGSMFGSLSGYKKQKYYEQHPVMYLYTEQDEYKIELAYGCLIEAGQWTERAFMFEENVDSLIAYAEKNTTFKSGVRFEEGDKAIVFSTCSYEFDDARYVVIGILKANNSF